MNITHGTEKVGSVTPEHPQHLAVISTGAMDTGPVESAAVARHSGSVWDRTADRAVRAGAPVVTSLSLSPSQGLAQPLSPFRPELVGGVIDTIVVDMTTRPSHDTAHRAGTGQFGVSSVVASLISPQEGP
jgi:hypothetical protein